jgi:hypothetical protein
MLYCKFGGRFLVTSPLILFVVLLKAEEQTVRTLLHSLGLEKYLITFQTEEVVSLSFQYLFCIL